MSTLPCLGQTLGMPLGDMCLTAKEPPPPTTRVAKQLAKTRFCKHFLRGFCRYQDKCSYAHFAEELLPRPNLTKTKICVGFLTGTCRNNDCSYAHGLTELNQDIPTSDTKMALHSRLCGGIEGQAMPEGSPTGAAGMPLPPGALMPPRGVEAQSSSSRPSQMDAQVLPLRPQAQAQVQLWTGDESLPPSVMKAAQLAAQEAAEQAAKRVIQEQTSWMMRQQPGQQALPPSSGSRQQASGGQRLWQNAPPPTQLGQGADQGNLRSLLQEAMQMSGSPQQQQPRWQQQQQQPQQSRQQQQRQQSQQQVQPPQQMLLQALMQSQTGQEFTPEEDQELLRQVLAEIALLIVEEDSVEVQRRKSAQSLVEQRWEHMMNQMLTKRRNEFLCEGRCLIQHERKSELTFSEEQLVVYLLLHEPAWAELFPRLMARCSRMMASRMTRRLPLDGGSRSQQPQQPQQQPQQPQQQPQQAEGHRVMSMPVLPFMPAEMPAARRGGEPGSGSLDRPSVRTWATNPGARDARPALDEEVGSRTFWTNPDASRGEAAFNEVEDVENDGVLASEAVLVSRSMDILPDKHELWGEEEDFETLILGTKSLMDLRLPGMDGVSKPQDKALFTRSLDSLPAPLGFDFEDPLASAAYDRQALDLLTAHLKNVDG